MKNNLTFLRKKLKGGMSILHHETIGIVGYRSYQKRLLMESAAKEGPPKETTITQKKHLHWCRILDNPNLITRGSSQNPGSGKEKFPSGISSGAGRGNRNPTGKKGSRKGSTKEE